MPAETVSTQFHLPVGVQLITVYVDKKELSSLAEESMQLNAALKCAEKWRQENNSKVIMHISSQNYTEFFWKGFKNYLVFSGLKISIPKAFTEFKIKIKNLLMANIF